MLKLIKSKTKKTVGFIAASPIKNIYGTDIELIENDILCVKEEFKDKRLANLFI